MPYKIRYRDNGAVVIVSPTGRESDPVSYQGIARLDGYHATSDYYRGVLPTLFKVYAEEAEVIEESHQ